MKIKMVSDLKAINRRLEKLKNMHDISFLTEKIARNMKTEVALRFKREEDPEGNKWKPLKGSTITGRYRTLRFTTKKGVEKVKVMNRNAKVTSKTGKPTRISGTPKILQDTGRLRSSISISSDKEKAIIGTNLIYSTTHQFGLTKKGIPARPFMGLSEKQKARYREWIRKWKRGQMG